MNRQPIDVAAKGDDGRASGAARDPSDNPGLANAPHRRNTALGECLLEPLGGSVLLKRQLRIVVYRPTEIDKPVSKLVGELAPNSFGYASIAIDHLRGSH
jgi:hypothetical protein